MQHNHTQVAPTVRTNPVNPLWETIKWTIAIAAIISICHTLLTAGGAV